jgi:acyl-CoA reductase-like NAD-dependent aldehyde dehydrogenase
MQACARNLVPVKLELGGKSPQILFEDADLSRAIPALLRGIINNAGQVCSAGSRLLVSRRIQANVVEILKEKMDGIRLGAWHKAADMGPLISAEQKRRVESYVRSGIEEGARLVTRPLTPEDDVCRNGYFVRPALFDDVSAQMRIAQEEIFGPVLSVVGFDDPEEAIGIANGTRYGLVASVWTRNIDRAIRIAKRAQAGCVYINTYAFSDAIGASFGGYKQSGFGRSMGIDAVLEYTQVKSVIINATG